MSFTACPCLSPLPQQKARGKWTPWLDTVKDKGIDPHISKLSDIIVPTMDTARYLKLPSL